MVVGDVTGYTAAGTAYRMADYRLTSGSAAIDKGAAADAPGTDILGVPRPFDIPGMGANGTRTEYDIGAYECLDATPPSGSILINGGAAFANTTSVTLTLSASDAGSGLTRMRLSNSYDFNTEQWEPYAASRSWTLTSGDGFKVVYVRYADIAGNASYSATGMIWLDTMPPAIALSCGAPDPVDGDIAVVAMLSEPSTDFTAGDITAANATVVGFSGSGSSYAFTLHPLLRGLFSCRVEAGKFRDAAGNPNAFESYTVQRLYPSPLPEALDNTALAWTNADASPWYGQEFIRHDGVDAGPSGAIADDGSTSFSTQVQGPGRVSFWWKVSSEAEHDFLRFSVDGVLKDRISGNVWFSMKSYDIFESGTHVLKWKYSKDASGSAGQDCGWVDQVVFMPFVPLGEALDNTALVWTTPGNAWIGQSATTHDGQDAAQSIALSHNQAAEFGTQVTGPGTLSFWWKVSSEVDHDFLRFSVDGVLKDRISGDTWFGKKSYNILGAGTHVLKWKYSKDATGSAGQDCGWVDQVVFTPFVFLGEALDSPGLPWTSPGDAWFGQSATTHDGQDAGQSMVLGDNQAAELSTEITGPGTLSFWWKVSSEADHDFLRFSVDGVLQVRISGNMYFAQKQYALGAGAHTLRWKYSKDAAGSAGMDAAWLDQVVWVPESKSAGGGQTKLGGAMPSESKAEGTPLRIVSLTGGGWAPLDKPHTLSVKTEGGHFPLAYQWRKDGVDLEGAADDSLRLDALTESDSGVYTVMVRDAKGTESSASATVTVTSGLAAPSGALLALLAGVLACSAFVLLRSNRQERE